MNKHKISCYMSSVCAMLNFFAAINSAVKPNHYVWVLNAAVSAICLIQAIEEYNAYNQYLH